MKELRKLIGIIRQSSRVIRTGENKRPQSQFQIIYQHYF